MIQDPTTMNRFQRDATKRGVKATERTKSWGAVQKDKALALADQRRNRFGAPNLPKDRKLEAAAAAQTPVLIINGRKYTDPKLVAAKAAMEQGRTDASHAAQLRNRTLAMQQDLASIKALFEGWVVSQKGRFYPSPFNMENMSRALGSVIAQSDRVMSVELLDEVFEYLKTHNYLESAIRRRGEPMALRYPEYVPPVAPAGARVPVHVPAEPTLPEGQDARTMPLDELAKLVRAGYKPEARR
jgi:hypothetical protein